MFLLQICIWQYLSDPFLSRHFSATKPYSCQADISFVFFFSVDLTALMLPDCSFPHIVSVSFHLFHRGIIFSTDQALARGLLGGGPFQRHCCWISRSIVILGTHQCSWYLLYPFQTCLAYSSSWMPSKTLNAFDPLLFLPLLWLMAMTDLLWLGFTVYTHHALYFLLHSCSFWSDDHNKIMT